MGNPRNLFRPTGYFKPTSVPEATKLLAQHGNRGRLIAGGTDILVEKDPEIEVLIDITGLGLEYIESNNQGVRIGATTPFASIAVFPVLSQAPYCALAQAAQQLGTPQIRNVATIGGNICSAVPSADSAPALLVLDATLIIAGPTGERSMNIGEFFQDARRNALHRGELVTEIRLSTLPARTGTAFIKTGRIATGDLAIVNTAVCLTVTADNICQDGRIALGAVAPTPVRAKKAEAMLRGERLQDELLRKVATQASKEINPIDDIRSSAQYRSMLSSILVERALREAASTLFA